jgi:hypothetical protein
VKVPKTDEKNFEVTVGLLAGHDLTVRSGKQNFKTQPWHTSKEAEFYVDFKIINIT